MASVPSEAHAVPPLPVALKSPSFAPAAQDGGAEPFATLLDTAAPDARPAARTDHAARARPSMRPERSDFGHTPRVSDRNADSARNDTKEQGGPAQAPENDAPAKPAQNEMQADRAAHGGEMDAADASAAASNDNDHDETIVCAEDCFAATPEAEALARMLAADSLNEPSDAIGDGNDQDTSEQTVVAADAPVANVVQPEPAKALAAALAVATTGGEAAAGDAASDAADTGAIDAEAKGAKPDPAAFAALAAALQRAGAAKPAGTGAVTPEAEETADAQPAAAAGADGDADDMADIQGAPHAATAGVTGRARPAAELRPLQPAEASAAEGDADAPQQVQSAGGQSAGGQEAKAAAAAQLSATPGARNAATAENRADNTLRTPQAITATAGEQAGAAKPASDPLANFGPLATHPAGAATAAADRGAQPPRIEVTGLAIEIVARAQSGATRFEIRLDPPELGRVDVRLDVDRDGNVSSKLYVERSETLDLLRREAPQLERALQQAGLKMSDNALEFALRDHAFKGDDGAEPHQARPQIVVADGDAVPAETTLQAYARYFGLGGGVDIRV